MGSFTVFAQESAVSNGAYPFMILTAIVMSPLHFSYMCKKTTDSVLKISLGLETIVFLPYRSIYGVGPNLRGKSSGPVTVQPYADSLRYFSRYA